MKNNKLQTLIEIAIFAAFALVLDLLPSFKPHPSISISFAMIPIFIIAFRRGVGAGMIAGFLWGILQIVVGDAWILTPTQAFIEYIIAFACVGFAGLFSNIIQTSFKEKRTRQAITWVVVGTFVGSFIRYFWHFVAGVVFFKDAAVEAGKAPVIFSLTMNGITFIGAFVTCAILLSLLLAKVPTIITDGKTARSTKKAS